MQKMSVMALGFIGHATGFTTYRAFNSPQYAQHNQFQSPALTSRPALLGRPISGLRTATPRETQFRVGRLSQLSMIDRHSIRYIKECLKLDCESLLQLDLSHAGSMRQVCDFSEEQLTPFVDALPLRVHPGASLFAMDAFVKERALDLFDYALDEKSSIELGPPPTLPSTQSRVVMIRHDAAAPNAVFKVFYGDRQPFVREVLANALIRRGDRRLASSIFEIGRVKIADEIYPYMIMEAAEGVDLEAMSREVGSGRHHLDSLKSAVYKAGVSAGRLHTAFSACECDESCKDIRRYHVGYVRRLIGDEGVLEGLLKAGWLTPEQTVELSDYVATLADKYEQDTGKFGLAAVVHGDYHMGNIVYNPETGSIKLIDNETMLWSLAPDPKAARGVADVAEDTGRFLEALMLNGVRFGLEPTDVLELSEHFLKGYADSRPDGVKEMEAALPFFRVRYAAVILESITHCWGEGKSTCTLKIGEDAARRLVGLLCERAQQSKDSGC